MHPTFYSRNQTGDVVGNLFPDLASSSKITTTNAENYSKQPIVGIIIIILLQAKLALAPIR